MKRFAIGILFFFPLFIPAQNANEYKIGYGTKQITIHVETHMIEGDSCRKFSIQSRDYDGFRTTLLTNLGKTRLNSAGYMTWDNLDLDENKISIRLIDGLMTMKRGSGIFKAFQDEKEKRPSKFKENQSRRMLIEFFDASGERFVKSGDDVSRVLDYLRAKLE